MSFKRAKVVMLPTKEKAKIGEFIIIKYEDSDKLNSGLKTQEAFNAHFPEQHLYFISHEKEIAVNDWFITNQAPQQCIEIREGDNYPYRIRNSSNGELQYHSKHWHGVIIASTNPSLGLPQPSGAFIWKFIERWNEDKKIEEVDIEYESNWYTHCPSGKYHDDEPVRMKTYLDRGNDYLKVNPKDNTITIKSIKNSWTREEFIGIIKQFGRDFGIYVDTVQHKEINEWISKNL
jgi:hypothetical protein